MFVPPAFAETDLATLHTFIRRHSFGTLVSQVEGAPYATHLPLLLRPMEGTHGALVGHFARANPHWRHLAGQRVLAIFTGPHVYVSPTWYEAPNTVPTWNFTAVHASGTVELIDDGPSLRAILQESVATYEQGRQPMWTFDDTTTFAERMIEQIVGFRLVIERMEGKFKLSQNHPVERREKVIRALEQQPDEHSQGVAQLMRERL